MNTRLGLKLEIRAPFLEYQMCVVSSKEKSTTDNVELWDTHISEQRKLNKREA